MKKVDNKEIYMKMFSEYTHNVPVIYSSLEGQYEGELFVDSEINPQISILFTPFAFHFVAGNAETANIVDLIDEIIFKNYLYKTNQKEAIVFSPNDEWDKVLDKVFKKYNGIKDYRNIFKLNKDKFMKLQSENKILEDIEVKIAYEQDNGSKQQYPVCRILKDKKHISFCSAFMLGKNHAEIDVSTEETYRGKGYAKQASFNLINELLKKGIEPDWCTWPYRVESERLALSLGYELKDKVPAHIWVEDECGKIK